MKRIIHTNTHYEIIGRGTVTLHWRENAYQFPPEHLPLVEDIWQKRPATIYNGRLFVVESINPMAESISVMGGFTEYRFYYAQQRSQQTLGIVPLGVSGVTVTVCQKHLILARRAATTTAYPGWLELVPSGSLDENAQLPDGQVDFQKMLLQEFAEETGLPANVVSKIEPLGIVYDKQDPTYDVICKIEVDTSPQDILDSMAQSGEYDAPLAVPIADLSDWYTQHSTQLIPTSHAALAVFLHNIDL